MNWRLAAGIALGYVLLVVGLQAFVGLVQFDARTGLTITTTDDAGASSDRKLGRFDLDGAIYVSAHHWPRAWYRAARARPHVEATIEGRRGHYLAVPVEKAAQIERLELAFPLPLWFRFVTGFAPRAFLRLDPRPADSPATATDPPRAVDGAVAPPDRTREPSP